MASSTSPDSIVYPDASDPIAPLNAVFQDLAESVQVALDARPSGGGGAFETSFLLMGA